MGVGARKRRGRGAKRPGVCECLEGGGGQGRSGGTDLARVSLVVRGARSPGSPEGRGRVSQRAAFPLVEVVCVPST